MSHAIQHFFEIKFALSMIKAMQKSSLCSTPISVIFMTVAQQGHGLDDIQGSWFDDVSSNQGDALVMKQFGVMCENKMWCGSRTVSALIDFHVSM